MDFNPKIFATLFLLVVVVSCSVSRVFKTDFSSAVESGDYMATVEAGAGVAVGPGVPAMAVAESATAVFVRYENDLNLPSCSDYMDFDKSFSIYHDGETFRIAVDTLDSPCSVK